MPKQEIDGEELFNLALSIVGLVLRDGAHSVAELAEHFGYSEKTIKKAARTIGNTENLSECQTYFYLDDELLEDGEVDFSQAFANLSEPPALSKRQVTSLATGLDFLAALPQFETNQELQGLRQIIGGSNRIQTQRAVSTRATELVGKIQDAMLNAVALECVYVNQLGEKASRRIDPLRVDFVANKHYLRGYCHKNHAVRSFRLDRMLDATVTTDPISEAAKLANIPDEVFGDGLKEQQVLIRARPEASEIFWNFPSYSEIRRENEELVGHILVGSLRALGRHIARYGGLVRVLEPQDAVVAVREFAQRALEQGQLKDED